MKSFILLGVAMTLLFALSACRQQHPFPAKAPAGYVQGELAKLAPVALECDLSALSAADKAALAKIIEAAKVVDQLFLLQVDPDNPALLKKLESDSSPANQPYRDLFSVMFGPWNRLEHDKPFLLGAEKPQGAGFYPQDMTKEEFESWIASPSRTESCLREHFHGHPARRQRTHSRAISPGVSAAD